MNSKAAIRKAVIANRNALDAEYRQNASRLITERFASFIRYRLHLFCLRIRFLYSLLEFLRNRKLRPGSNVLSFVSFGSEVDTSNINAQIIAAGHNLVLPRVHSKAVGLTLHVVRDLASLVRSKFGILEPPEHLQSVSVDECEFVVMPGVAFTPQCKRIGYGAGFYDRLLATTNSTTAAAATTTRRRVLCAICFDMQILGDVDNSIFLEHDIDVHYVLSENRSIRRLN
jgi:5-formyltetrahydrofolate cyclo-ligase